MDHKRRIAVATANRAERGILAPVIRRLEARRASGEVLFDLWDASLNDPMETAGETPDVVLIPADRKEMALLAAECFYARIPIFHLWAGIGYTGTWDDVNRRVISSFAYLMMCESEDCRQRLIRSGEEPWRVVTTGSPHFDDLVIDETLCPPKPYDLVLINTNPADPEDYELSKKKASDMLEGQAVWIGASDDPNVTIASNGRAIVTFYATLPRPKFLGLLKNCRRYISNSSSIFYEAPFFGTTIAIVNPGRRNAARKSTFEPVAGAADRIVDLLVNFPIDKSKLKRYD